MRRGVRAVLVVVVALPFALHACTFDDPARNVLPPVDSALDAAVEVRADGCGPRIGLGTGSMIDEHLAVTAAHVVAGSDHIDVADSDGNMVAADVVSFDPDLDLAILRTTDAIGDPLTIRSAEARVDEIGVVALPRRDDAREAQQDSTGQNNTGQNNTGQDGVEMEIAKVRVLRAVNIRTTDIYLDDPVERAGFEIAAEIDPGDSGAVVVMPGGAVGVIWARSNQRDARAWAVDLPSELADDAVRRQLADPATSTADVGACIRVVGQPG